MQGFSLCFLEVIYSAGTVACSLAYRVACFYALQKTHSQVLLPDDFLFYLFRMPTAIELFCSCQISTAVAFPVLFSCRISIAVGTFVLLVEYPPLWTLLFFFFYRISTVVGSPGSVFVSKYPCVGDRQLIWLSHC